MASDTKPVYVRADEKNGRISGEKIFAAAKVDDSPKQIRWHGLPITVRPMLSIQEVGLFIEDVIGACLDTERGADMPELSDYLTRINTVLRYSNAGLPDNPDEQYKLMYGSDLYDQITQNICKEQFESIKESIRFWMER